MASPAPNSQSHAKEHYYYFVIAVAVIAVLLIASNMLVVGCCSRCRLVRRFLQSLGILSSSPEGDHISHAIPSCQYRKEKAAAESECSVCLMAFVEGEEVRQMPKCKHLFHAPCIDMWLYSHSNCPMCRADVLPKALQSHHTTTAAAAAAGAAREDAGYSWRSLIESGSMTGVVVSML